MEVQDPPRLDNSLHCLQSPVLRAASGVFFNCGAHFAVTPFSHSSAFFFATFSGHSFCFLLHNYSFSKFFFLYFSSVPFSFLPFTLKNRKTSSCKVRLRLVWDQGGCCCSRCAGIASRVLVGRVSMLNPQGAQTAVLTSSGKSNMWNLEGQDWGFLPDISTCEETQRRARGGQDS